MDTKGKGYVTLDEVKALSLDQLRAISDITDADPANTEEYEHAIFDADDVRYISVHPHCVYELWLKRTEMFR